MPAMSESLRIIVPGIPQTKGSTRAFVPKGWTRPIITNDNAKAKGWQQLISQRAAAALETSNQQPFADGPVLLDVWFYFPRPQKFLTKKYAALDVAHTTKPDSDKCLRVVKDALSRVVYRDDSCVVDAYVHKRYCAAGELPRAEITVRAVMISALPKPVAHIDAPLLLTEEGLYAAGSTDR